MPLPKRCRCATCLQQNPEGVKLPAPAYRLHSRAMVASTDDPVDNLKLLHLWSNTLKNDFENSKPSTTRLVFDKSACLDLSAHPNDHITKYLAALSFFIKDVEAFHDRDNAILRRHKANTLSRARKCLANVNFAVRRAEAREKEQRRGRLKLGTPLTVETSETPRYHSKMFCVSSMFWFRKVASSPDHLNGIKL
ncbi:hypothetical protein FRB94_010939 [Tulasnella sp. JGI-2019a]|nr:hypothetical protein FRB94_010939 [Tulasnella sp. JGI-2019a]